MRKKKNHNQFIRDVSVWLIFKSTIHPVYYNDPNSFYFDIYINPQEWTSLISFTQIVPFNDFVCTFGAFYHYSNFHLIPVTYTLLKTQINIEKAHRQNKVVRCKILLKVCGGARKYHLLDELLFSKRRCFCPIICIIPFNPTRTFAIGAKG